MTRRVFGEQVQFHGSAGPSAQIKAYLAPTGGSPVDVTDEDDNVLADGIITLVNDVVPVFKGPDDGTSVLWLDTVRDTGDSRVKTTATDTLPAMAGSVPVEVRPPDYNFESSSQWVNVWEVYWPGGVVTFPHEFIGTLDAGQSAGWNLLTAPITNADELAAYAGDPYSETHVDNVAGDLSWYSDVAVEVPEGRYALVIFEGGDVEPTGRLYLSPVLPDGMLWSPPAAGPSAASGTVGSHIQLSNTGSTSLPAAGTATLLPVTVDGGGTEDITRDADGHTIVLAEAGLYSISVEIQTTTGHTVTAVMVEPGDWDPFPLAGKYGEDFANRKAPRVDGAIVAFKDIYKVEAGTTFVFYVSANADTDSAVSWFGADIIRLA